MAENELSQNEINELLGSIAGDGDAPAGEETAAPVLPQNEIDDLLDNIAAGDEVPAGAAEESMTVRIYDFIRPDIFSKSDIRRLNEKADRLLNSFSSSLSALTGKRITGSISSIDELTLDECMRCQPDPGVIIPIDFFRPEKGGIFFQRRTAALLGRLFMGYPPSLGESSPEADLHPLRLRIFRKLIDLSLAAPMGEIIHPCSLPEVHTRPEAGILGDPLEMLLLVSMDLAVPEYNLSDMVSLAFPGFFLREILSSNDTPDGREPAGTDYLVHAGIQFPSLMDEAGITGVLCSQAEISMDSRIIGTMSYDKRREA